MLKVEKVRPQFGNQFPSLAFLIARGGGHTGDIPTSILIPQVVEICNKAKSPLTGEKVHVVAAGAMYNGKSLAAALAFGAEAVWVGTRFVAAKEAGAPKGHQDAVVTAGYTDTMRTIIFTGRPLRVRKNDYIERFVMHQSMPVETCANDRCSWEARPDEVKTLVAKGIIPVVHDLEEREKKGDIDEETEMNARPYLVSYTSPIHLRQQLLTRYRWVR